MTIIINMCVFIIYESYKKALYPGNAGFSISNKSRSSVIFLSYVLSCYKLTFHVGPVGGSSSQRPCLFLRADQRCGPSGCFVDLHGASFPDGGRTGCCTPSFVTASVTLQNWLLNHLEVTGRN